MYVSCFGVPVTNQERMQLIVHCRYQIGLHALHDSARYMCLSMYSVLKPSVQNVRIQVGVNLCSMFVLTWESCHLKQTPQSRWPRRVLEYCLLLQLYCLSGAIFYMLYENKMSIPANLEGWILCTPTCHATDVHHVASGKVHIVT